MKNFYENAIIYIFGIIGIVLCLCMIAFFEGEWYLHGVACLILSLPAWYVSVSTWKYLETKK